MVVGNHGLRLTKTIREDVILLDVLIVDDDEVIRIALKRIIGKLGYNTLEVDSIQSATAILETRRIDAVFCDVRFPADRSGVEILDFIVKRDLDTRVIMMSCAMDDAAVLHLTKKGAAKCLEKPFFKDVCLETLTSLFPERLSAV